MTIAQLKTAVLSIAGITTEWVRSEFGDLRLKATWQAAYDRTREFVAVAVDRAVTAAQYAVALLVPCLWAVLWFGCLCYHTGEALAGWWHSAPSKATDSTAVVLSRFQDARLSSTVSILA